MDSEFSYQYAHRAYEDVDKILTYMTQELQNPTAAANFLNNLTEAIAEICLFPQSGLSVFNGIIQHAGVRKVHFQQYVLYYLPDVSSRTIIILRVVYARRNLEEILKELDL